MGRVDSATRPLDPAPCDPSPYDAVLLLSFGGPEGPEDVIPFLENVARGRPVAPERLEAVAEHYRLLGGRSPVNDETRALSAALRRALDSRGLNAFPVYWGCRNWRPYLVDTLRDAHEAGARRLAAVATSAFSSYSGCRRYGEDLADALAELAGEGRAMTVDKIRPYFNHPGFVDAAVGVALDGLRQVGRPASPGRDDARLLVVTHSLPAAMNDASGPDGGAYVAQHLDVALLVAEAVSARAGRVVTGDLAYCSRSGPAGQAWLEPDVSDRLRALHADGAGAVVVVPLGFVCDNVEVLYDLDVEARATAAGLGLGFVRAATVGTHPSFVEALADLLLERAAAERGVPVRRPAAGRLAAAPDRCPAGCCAASGPRRRAARGAGVAR
jgi:ferrochelatase